SISMTQAAGPVYAATSQTYTLTITNVSTNAAQDVVITDTLPTGTTYQSTSANDPAICQAVSGVVTCHLPTLAAGGTVTLSVTVNLDLATRGTIINSASVSSTTPDSNSSNNQATLTTTIVVPTTLAPAPVLISPVTAAILKTHTPTLTWNAVSYVYYPVTYQVMVDNNATFVSPEFNATGLNLTTVVTATLPDGVYSWRVRAVDLLGRAGAWSAVRNFTVDTVPSLAPALTSPADNVTLTTARPTFIWAAIAGANRYRLQVDDDTFFGSPEINIFPIATMPSAASVAYMLVTSLQQGSYHWRVQAYDVAGNPGNFSAIRTFKVNIQLTPANGVSLAATSTITFTWQPVVSATGYQVQVATDAAFTTNLTSYDVIGGTVGTRTVPATSVAGTYYWRVNVNLGSGLQVSPFYRSLIAPAVAPLAPVLLSPANAVMSSANTLTLTWATIKDVVGRDATYQIQVDNTATFVSPEYTINHLNGTSTTTSTLVDGLYIWRVRAISSSNLVGPWSVVRTFTIDTKAPLAPALSLPVNGAIVANARPTFSWLAVVGANRYRLQVDDDAGFGSPEINIFPVTTLSYALITSLQQGTYNWRVQAYDAAGNAGTFSAIRTFKVNIQLTPANGISLPVTPTITFTWQPVVNATGYQVQIATDAAFTVNLTTYAVNNGTVGSLVVPAASVAGSYYWRVNVNLGSGIVISPFYRSFTSPSAPPPAPILINPVTGGATNSTTPTLTWSSIKDLIGRDMTYQIQVDNTATFISPEYSANGLTSTSTATSTLANGSYSWRVRAISGSNLVGAWSTVRTFIVDTLPPPAPALSAPANGVMLAVGRPTFSWLASAGANHYRLQVDDDAAFGSPEINAFPITTLSYALITTLQQGTYSWRVQAYDAAENVSAWSAVRTFKINVQLTPANGASLTPTATITCTWQPVATAVGFQLQIATDSAFTANLTTYDINSGTVGTRTVPAAAVAGTYYWRVNVNLGNGLVISPFYRSFVAPAVAPLAPALINPTAGFLSNVSGVTLSWSEVKDLVGRTMIYQIQVDNAATFASPEFAVSNVSGTSTTTISLPNGIYNWRVRTLLSNNSPVMSAWSIIRTFTLAAP
ncbi:MAG: DUF11 domain-containing protein, partial [Anaerolineae bacterium]|nr:DUF11 domain-containing protein [Anaerolineae bacterium]